MVGDREWDQLPELALWTIRARLNVIDSQRFTAVCKEWHKASESFPENLKLNHNGLPWIMVTDDCKRSVRHFISLSISGQPTRYTLEDKIFQRTILLGSRKGWLLFAKIGKQLAIKSRGTMKLMTRYPFFLFNLYTKSKIDMPYYDHKSFESTAPSWGGFSSLRISAPNSVVLSRLRLDYPYVIAVWFASPGDCRWNCYGCGLSLESAGRMKFINYQCVVANRFYCLGKDRLISFDLETRNWMNLELKYGIDAGLYEILGVDEDDTISWLKLDMNKDGDLGTQNSLVMSKLQKKAYHCESSLGEDCIIAFKNWELEDCGLQKSLTYSLKKTEVGNWVDVEY